MNLNEKQKDKSVKTRDKKYSSIFELDGKFMLQMTHQVH